MLCGVEGLKRAQMKEKTGMTRPNSSARSVLFLRALTKLFVAFALCLYSATSTMTMVKSSLGSKLPDSLSMHSDNPVTKSLVGNA